MKKNIFLLTFYLLAFLLQAKSQNLPIAADTAIKTNLLMQVQRNAVRIAINSIDNSLYYITFDGKIYKILKNGTVYSDSLVASSTQTNINFLQGIVFKDSSIYLVGNKKTPNTAGYGLVIRGKMQASGTWAWDTIMHTATYQSTATLYDHAFSSICLTRNKDSLLIGSGARTDHGEVETSGNLFPNTREVPLTSVIFRIPINPSATIFLPNDSALLAASSYVYCRGVRNSFDLAVAPNGDIIGTENADDRDDSEELNWLQKDRHYGYPWRIGGNNTPMQFLGYNPNTDKLINHLSLGWGNGTTTNKFYNDSTYPVKPPGLIFTEPIINYGPDADKFRDPITGSVRDASEEGGSITSFTSHRSPLGLVFDSEGNLAPPYNLSSFVLSYTEGTADSTGSLPNGSTGPFKDLSQDLLQLALYKDSATNQYSMNCYKIAWNFIKPVDAFLKNNILYVLESHTANDPIPPQLYELTFPMNVSGGADFFIGKDTTICAGNSFTIIPKLKGNFNYLWSTGSTASQITVAPSVQTKYWLRISNGLVTVTDTLKITVLPVPTTPAAITVTGGAAKVCLGGSRYYAVPQISGMTYTWSVPPGTNILSGQGTRKILVSFDSSFFSMGTISIVLSNSCGISSPCNIVVKRNDPLIPGTITGDKTGLCGAVNKLYKVTNVSGITYNWDLPPSAVITSGQGTNSITVDFPSTNFTGVIAVIGSNVCGFSPVRSATLKALPPTPVEIFGQPEVCPNSTGNNFSITPIPTAVSYTWIGPSGSHITANGITSTNNTLTTSATNVTIAFAAINSLSTLKAKANNSCGAGSAKVLTLIKCPIRIADETENPSPTIYPNPTHGIFNIVFNSMKNKLIKVAVHTVIGQEIFRNDKISSNESDELAIDLNNYPNGVYILTIVSDGSEEKFKIIKQ